MEFKQIFKKLKESNEFKQINKKNKDIFFSYALKMIEENKEHPWQFGFYNESTGKIFMFIVNNGNIETNEEEEVFKKPETKVNPIDLEKVKVSFKELLTKTESFRKKKYSNELVNKTIVILQNLDKYGIVWNLTFLTHSFSTLNMKVNAENGKIETHNIDSLLSFDKK